MKNGKNPIKIARKTPATAARKAAAPAPAKSSGPPAAKPHAAQPNPTVRLELYAPQAREVCVVGSFNEWRPRETKLKSSSGGLWAGELALPPGRYEYLFL